MEEVEISLEEKDLQRLQRIHKVLSGAHDVWETAIRLIIPDYLDQEKFPGNNKVHILEMDFSNNKIKVGIGDS